MKVIGFLNSGAEGAFRPFVDAFRKGLNEAGFIEGPDLKIEYRWADGDYQRLPTLAKELVKLPVDIIATAGGAVAAQAAMKATRKIPILFVSGYNPAKVGLVAANTTGVNVATTESVPHRVALLRKLLAKGTKIAVFLRPGTDVFKFELAAAKKEKLIVVRADYPIRLEDMFEEAVAKGAGALLVCADPSFTQRRKEIVALAAKHKLPAAYPWHEYVEDGGFMSHGPSLPHAYRRIGLYAAMILDGEKARKLPIHTTSAFTQSINLKTALDLGLRLHPALLRVHADKVVE
jgi:putative tryptophan/tyrosine transport system substrate-binding protein